MKKLTSIATALCMATAFCGFCAGCASEVEANGINKCSRVPINTSAVDTTPKVILNPGYQYGYGSTPNTVDTGAEKLSASDEEKYWVSNAYFATVGGGADLPAATTTRAKTTFVGWTYAKDGVVETVKKMPTALEDDLYLYAQWKTEGSGGTGSGEDPGGDIVVGGDSATVNGKVMTKNPTPDNGVELEYMVTEITLDTGDVLAFTVNGSAVTVGALDGASTGLSYSSGKVTVAKGGTFALYLKKKDDGWELYGSRSISSDEVTITGENAVAGNVYLAGNISGADFNWNDWNDSMNVHKGIKATKSGSTYSLTVKLTKGDNCKFVKYGTTSSVWQKSLTGAGASNITYNGGDMDNMIIKTTGTYTFTITESSSSLAVSVTFAA